MGRILDKKEETPRCKICGNPDLSDFWSGDNPNTVVCDTTCAAILNTKLIIFSVIFSIIAILGSIIVYIWYLIIFIPVGILSFYGLYLILTKREEKRQDRLKFIGEEDEDEVNYYTR